MPTLSTTLAELMLGRDEVALAVQPRRVGRVDAGSQRRMNAFAGRALTAPLLQAEQNHRSRHLSLLNRGLSAGVVEGLELAFDDAALAPLDSAFEPPPAELALTAPRRLTLAAGNGLHASGAELLVPRNLDFDALDLPVVVPPWLLDGDAAPARPGGDVDGSVLDARRVGASLRTLLAAGIALPPVGIVLLQPVEHWRVDAPDRFDQCERDLDAEAFEDQQRRDAARLLYYAWPDEWLTLPAPDRQWRNRLAWRVFGRESEAGASALPWLQYGVPLALVAFNAAWQPLFADRAAVARSGGRPRDAMPAMALPAALLDDTQRRITARRDRFLRRAQIEQLAEQLAEQMADAGADSNTLGLPFATLPPAGLLPADALDLRRRINRFFPPALQLFAAPLPIEQLDLLFDEAAGLAPIDTAVRDRIGVYVPVPQAVFTPDLLVVEQADPSGEMAATLTRFVSVRTDWLGRRQNLREKRQALQRAIDGANAPPLPSPADDGGRLEDETSTPPVPVPAGLLHRSAQASGVHQHLLEKAEQPLHAEDGQRLYAWVLIDREAPPQQLMLQFHSSGQWLRAYWGANLIDWGSNGEPTRLRIGAELPPPGVWTRLEIPINALKLGGAPIDGVAFTLFDGRACFGPLGVLAGEGEQAEESPWVDDKLLQTSQQRGDGEAWDIVADADRDSPFEAGHGTTAIAADGQPARQADALTALLARADLGALKLVDADADAASEDDRAKAPTLAALIRRQGLRATVNDLVAHLDSANDALDLGFLRVQTDLYRLRQSVLKQTQATRFAVSPALTQIAELDNASATREQLADFYQTVRADKTVLQRDDGVNTQLTRRSLNLSGDAVAGQRDLPGPEAAAPLAAARGIFDNTSIKTKPVFGGSTGIGIGTPTRVGGSVFTGGAVGVGGIGGIGGSVSTGVLSGVLTGVGVDRADLLNQNLGVGVRPGFRTELGLGLGTGGMQAEPPPTTDTVKESDALTGKAEIRTTSIASRLERPRSIEAKDYSVATRADIVGKLAALKLDLDALPVHGLAARNEAGEVLHEAATGQPQRSRMMPLGDLRRLQFAPVLNDPDPASDKADESAFFFSGVDLSDFSVALLRNAEGSVRRYREALDACRATLATLDQQLAGAQARLSTIDRELAEARQDVASARALLAEEQQRVDALNAGRDEVIARHVKFLAFARARIGQRVIDTPRRALDSANEPDAVPACLADHAEPPADVRAMLALLRQAPLDWFPALRRQLVQLDQPQVADRLLSTLVLQPPAQLALRIDLPQFQNLQLADAARQPARLMLQAQTSQLAQTRAAALPLLQASIQPGAALSGKLAAIGATLGASELLAAPIDRGALQRRVAAEFEQIERIATCLHARLSTVRPAIRLQWAEAYSQFDAARGQLDLGDLGDLDRLPRFGELPRDEREAIRDLAGWLRRRVAADNAGARALMADLLRVCVLAASHSPAGELLSGRVVRPQPLNPGLLLQVQPHLPDRVRLGAEVQFFNGAQLSARAVVADLAGGVASVRVTHTASANVASTAATAVRFVLR